MSVYANEFRAAFLQEAREHANALEHGLLALEANPQNTSVLNDIFRAAHSIKGAAGTLGFTQIADFTHVFESLLDEMRRGEVAATSERITILLHSTDDLRRLLDACESGGTASASVEPILAQMSSPPRTGTAAAIENQDLPHTKKGGNLPPHVPSSMTGAPLSASTVGTTDVFEDAPASVHRVAGASVGGGKRTLRLSIRPVQGFFITGLDPLLLFRDLARLGTLEHVVCDMSRIPRLSEMSADDCFLSWTVTLVTDASDSDVRDVFLFVTQECPVTIATDEAPLTERGMQRAQQSGDLRHAQREASTLRVASEKVDAIIDLVGELVIAQSMVMQLIAATAVNKSPILRDAISSMSRNMQELQQRVMSIRMVPISTLFGRFSRLVRDTAAGLGKSVRLAIEGQDTEIDKAVIEHLVDPITHLVRNALDHGLETDEERTNLGKHEPATLTLRAQHVAGAIVIDVSDNGRGLDLVAIRSKAERLGLVSASDTLSDDQIHALIFEPGFSTASTITDLSGRGVGLDVARRSVDSLNGTIGIITQLGIGTTFQIRLPLTLAILDGLLLRVGTQTYVLPLLNVVESFRPSKSGVRTVTGAGTVVAVRDAWVPVLDLGVVFGINAAARQPDAALVVIVEAQGNRIGLVVDGLVGQSQVVVKSIETNYRKVDGILGATILGDGHVAFILDISCIVRIACAQHTAVKTRAA